MNLIKKFIARTAFDVIIIFILIFFGYYFNSQINFWTLSAGIIFIFAATFGLTARHQLGKAYSVKAEAKTLVNQGVYSKIRHPIYLAGILSGVGICLLYKNIAAYLLLAATIAIQITRAKKEEALLTKTFGQKYLDYKKSTWF